ncbi:MAG TPA: hypothetical protein PLD62_10995, partial [Candidatus Cloacimonadota bacterium]|nr:hypothetical protein [Candidatus Cloacimonadota bacterium]
GYQIEMPDHNYQVGDKVFLVGMGDVKFKTKFALEGKKLNLRLPEARRTHILSRIGSTKILNRQELFIRIDSTEWLKKIYFDKFDYLILKLSKNEWQKLNLKSPFFRNNQSKIIIQLPKFIPEADLNFYSDLCRDFVRNRISHFMLGHVSQKQLFPAESRLTLSASENIYTLNDAAIQFLKEENFMFYIYPLENDFPNLMQGKDRKGIVPLFFSPELFFSRMPVNDLPENFSDQKNKFRKIIRSGFTVIIPELPVSLLQNKNKLDQKGFRRYLIDFSYEKPSQNTFNRLLKKFHTSEAEQPGTSFNFKQGLF